MKFGLHYLMSCSENQSPVQRYRDTVEQAVRAEALGFESAWTVQQHFNQVESALPCPTLMLAAIASRTRTLRLGTAIVQLALSHPLRIAEEIATLDVLSNGRVEFGVGRGSSPRHFAGFGVPLSESRERMVESLDYIRQAFTQERFSFQGRFFKADDICLVPKPVQKPHPPITVAATGPDTFEFSGRSGYPIFVASHINPLPKLRELVPVYRNFRKEAGHPDAKGNDLSLLMPLYVGENRDQVKRDIEPAVKQFVHVLTGLLSAGSGKWATEAEAKHMEAVLEKTRGITYELMNDGGMGLFDTPEGCVERLKKIQQDLNPGRVICWFNFTGVIPPEKVLHSMELFSSKVLPHFE